jgi:hypothetical protein
MLQTSILFRKNYNATCPVVITILSTASIVASVMTTYFNLKSDVAELRNKQETTDRVNEIRLKLLESEVAVLQQEVQEIKYKQLTK